MVDEESEEGETRRKLMRVAPSHSWVRIFSVLFRSCLGIIFVQLSSLPMLHIPSLMFIFPYLRFPFSPQPMLLLPPYGIVERAIYKQFHC